MRLIYLNPVSTLGGAERSLLSLLKSVRQTEPTATLHLVLPEPGPLRSLAEELGVEVTTIPMPRAMIEAGVYGCRHQGNGRQLFGLIRTGIELSGQVVSYVGRLSKFLRCVRPTLVLSNGVKFHLLSPLFCSNRLPVVWHLQDFLSSKAWIGPGLRWAARSASGLIAVSKAVSDDALSTLGDRPITVVYNAIDTDHFVPSAATQALDQLGSTDASANNECLRVGLVATYARWKGQDVFLKAVSKILAKNPRHRFLFYIVGGPVYRTKRSQFSLEELQHSASELGVADRVRFIGFHQDPVAIYQGLDIVVHASTQPEPFGLTIIEAMACGKPVVVSQAGGATELFTPGQDAIGVSPGEEEALAAAISLLANDAVLRRRLGEAARRSAVARFSDAQLGPRVINAYRSFFAESRCRAGRRNRTLRMTNAFSPGSLAARSEER